VPPAATVGGVPRGAQPRKPAPVSVQAQAPPHQMASGDVPFADPALPGPFGLPERI
jgi:hypothetical protein